MTLTDIAAQLPNGFHDAFLRTLTVDYALAKATMAVRICVGDVNSTIEAAREAYRAATLTLTGLQWCVIERPNGASKATEDGLWIDAGPLNDLKQKPNLPAIPDDAFA